MLLPASTGANWEPLIHVESPGLGVPVAGNTNPLITLHSDSYGASLPPSQDLFHVCELSIHAPAPTVERKMFFGLHA